MKLRNKKGAIALGDVPNAITVLVTIGIFLTIGALILQSVQSNASLAAEDNCGSLTMGDGNWSSACNTTRAAISGITSLAEWQSIIAIAVAAAVVLGLIAFLRA